jgi:hypothetical protein
MSRARDEKDEFEHIMDSMSVEFRSPEELEKAANWATQQINEACSNQQVKIEDYKATREKCVRGIMEELGQTPMFNDIMDVVTVSQMSMKSGKKVSMIDKSHIDYAGGYFVPETPSKIQIPITNINIFGQIYDYLMGKVTSYEAMLYAGNTLIAAARNRDLIRGTVIHEFTHFAMYAVFKNDCFPYFDDKGKEKFSDIMKQTMNNLYVQFIKHEPVGLTIEQISQELSGIIPLEFTLVFSHELSDPNTYNKGFVVRLPEIFATTYLNANPPAKLMACLEPLASYWKDFITPQMRKFIDDHPKGHMVTSDRVYEGNALAHSGEHYLMLEGKETPAGVQAQALITAVKDNNVADCAKIIESALDDRLPRLALLKAIEHNRPAIAEIALKKIQHPKYMNSLLDDAIKRERPDIAKHIITYMEPDIISLARAGSADAIAFFLALPDSNVNAKDASEALILTARLGHADALTAILKAPNIVVSSKDVSEALIASSRADVVNAILKAPNIVVNAKDASEALILATRLGYADEVLGLIAAGANINAVGKNGKTAIDYAPTIEVKDMLIKAAAEANKVRKAEDAHIVFQPAQPETLATSTIAQASPQEHGQIEAIESIGQIDQPSSAKATKESPDGPASFIPSASLPDVATQAQLGATLFKMGQNVYSGVKGLISRNIGPKATSKKLESTKRRLQKQLDQAEATLEKLSQPLNTQRQNKLNEVNDLYGRKSKDKSLEVEYEQLESKYRAIKSLNDEIFNNQYEVDTLKRELAGLGSNVTISHLNILNARTKSLVRATSKAEMASNKYLKASYALERSALQQPRPKAEEFKPIGQQTVHDNMTLPSSHQQRLAQQSQRTSNGPSATPPPISG